LTDELWARKLRRQAPIRVQQNFSWSGVAVHLSDLYRRLLAQSISNAFFFGASVSLPSEQPERYPIRAEVAASTLTKVS
jgi:D-inositol-3-phosphate glycosyltransferase